MGAIGKPNYSSPNSQIHINFPHKTTDSMFRNKNINLTYRDIFLGHFGSTDDGKYKWKLYILILEIIFLGL